MAVTIQPNKLGTTDSKYMEKSYFDGAYANFGCYAQIADRLLYATTHPDGVGLVMTDVFAAKNIYFSGVADERQDKNGNPAKKSFVTEQNYGMNTRGQIGSWKHKYTGVYMFHMQYRQESGGDIWTQYAISKTDDPRTIHGLTARMGSEDAHREKFHMLYYVDDVNASYFVQGWTQATGRWVGGSTMGTADPTGFYENSDFDISSIANSYHWEDRYNGTQNLAYVSGDGDAIGKSVDCMIYRVADLPS